MHIAARVNVPLASSELEALVRMAADDVRHPREQLRYLLRTEAQRRGLLEPYQEDKNDATPNL